MSWTAPPPSGRPCDSVIASPQTCAIVKNTEVMVYRAKQAFVQFVVTYKHKESCNCKACRK